MVGVPRSKRCQRCKRIKVKCDENWPNCTPCVRANVPCSGPPTLTKFVHHHSTKEFPGGDQSKASVSALEKPTGSLESLRHRGLPGGASFDHFRLSSDEPRKNLTTVSDRVAARLVRFLEHENAPWDMLTSVGYMKHLPARLNESAALRDSVALMCSTWTNSRRNHPGGLEADPTLYGKALRSLQRALDDQQQQLSCETLAAVTVLERLEAVFDPKRLYRRSRHGSGIEGLMRKRGPPNLEDDLDLHLALENHAALISHWAVQGGDNFYLSSPWKEVIYQSRSVLERTVSKDRMDAYAIGLYYGYWPGLVHRLLNVCRNTDANTIQTQAEDLQLLIENLDTEIKRVCEPLVERARNTGRILEEPNPETPLGVKFHFKNLDTMSFVLSYVWMRIMLNRMLHHITLLLGQSNTLLDEENRGLSRQIWTCIPFMRNLGQVPSVFFRAPLFSSYEGANEVEKEYLLDVIIDMAAYPTGSFPTDRKAGEKFVLDTAKAMTGRSLFPTAIVISRDDIEQSEITQSYED